MMGAAPARRANVASVELQQFPNLPDGFRPEVARVGKLLGAARTGMSVYELPPGEAIGPYHYPDSDKISIWTTNGDDDIVVQRTSGVGYWDGESR